MKGTEELVEALGSTLDDVAELRYRGEGWPGFAKVRRLDGEISSMSYDDSWGTILNRHLQFRCKICPDGIGDFADVVAADLWDCDERGYPSFDEQPGSTLILARTRRGEELIRSAIAAGQLAVTGEAPEPARIGQSQPYQLERRTTLFARLMALKVALRHPPDFDVRVLWRASRQQSLLGLVRSFLQTLKRALRVRMGTS